MTPNRRLKQARELRGWSQAKVAEQIGTDATTVSRWERGLFSPTPYFRERLCTLFNKNAEELGLLDTGDRSLEDEPRAFPARSSTTLAFQQGSERSQTLVQQIGTLAPSAPPSWPRRGDTFAYILDSAAHDQQAHTLWEDAYVRVMRGQRAEAQQLGEASLSAFEHVGHPNAEAIREWLKKNELIPASPAPMVSGPPTPLPLLPKEPKRTIKQMFRRRNIGLAFILLAIAAFGLASYSFSHITAPSVQAGIQTTHPQAAAQAPSRQDSTATTNIAATVTPAPTARPTRAPATPAASVPTVAINVTPASLTPGNCQPDSGYRCTLYVTLYSSKQGNLSWQASSTDLAVRFNPASGTAPSGSMFEVIVYMQNDSVQHCLLTFAVKSSSATAKASVSWRD